MDIVTEAKNELGSGLVAYAEFVLDFKKDDEAIYCFYEGKEDRSYYSFRVRMIHPDNPYFDYVTLGKGNLLKVYDLIMNRKSYSESNVGFFIDKDFESRESNKEIYTTPYYSVENFYTVDDALLNTLTNEFNMPSQCDCRKNALQLFKSVKAEFHSQILTLNAWLACQTDIRLAKQESTRLNIDDTLKKVITQEGFDKIVDSSFKCRLPASLTTHEQIENLFDKSPAIPVDDLQQKIQEFSQCQLDHVFRGKFELHFLISFLKRFKDEIAKRKDSMFSKRYVCNLRFEYATAISTLTNNAITPIQLINYIKGIKKAA